MPPRFLDTNILMRYFTRDDEHKAAAALALLRRIQAGTEQVTTSPLVLFEVVFLLERTYQLPEDRVADAVLSVLTLPGVKLANKTLWRTAFQVHLTYPIDFADAYNTAVMQRTGVSEIYTWDEDFDRIPGLTRVEPGGEEEAAA